MIDKYQLDIRHQVVVFEASDAMICPFKMQPEFDLLLFRKWIYDLLNYDHNENENITLVMIMLC